MSEQSDYRRRSHTCGELRSENADERVILNGWVEKLRDHNHFAFLDLRDRFGVTQVFFGESDSDLLKRAQSLRPEDVVAVEGKVRQRPDDKANKERETGTVEVLADRLSVLNRSKTPPFEIKDDQKVSEEIRLRYRYLDLRRPKMQRNLKFRHDLFQAFRASLSEQDFVEIETPMLTRAMPEGARDYLVPSRLNAGSFYALPQSPQLFKQLMMVAGLDRYFQVARCLRDEDLRADRQPEFTQLDLEMSFVSEDDVFEAVESAFAASISKAMGKQISMPFARISHAESMSLYGTDKPDLRNSLRIVDVTEAASATDFGVFTGAVQAGGVVRCLPVDGGAACSRKDIDGLEARAKEMGAKGLAWTKINDSGEPAGGIARFLGGDAGQALLEAAGAKPGFLLLFGADSVRVACAALSEVRQRLGERFGGVQSEKLSFCWVVDFPLFEWDDDNQQFAPAQHAFTTPVEEYEGHLVKDPGTVRARAYDLVLNGWELGSGGIRIHDRDLQQRVFDALGINIEEARSRFGFLLDAFEFGAPPHGGIGIGLDRVVALLLGEENIREVVAFPKTASAACLMTGAPASVDAAQLEELRLRFAPESTDS